jgi:hypothetical protein
MTTSRVCETHQEYCPTGVCKWCEEQPVVESPMFLDVARALVRDGNLRALTRPNPLLVDKPYEEPELREPPKVRQNMKLVGVLCACGKWLFNPALCPTPLEQPDFDGLHTPERCSSVTLTSAERRQVEAREQAQQDQARIRNVDTYGDSPGASALSDAQALQEYERALGPVRVCPTCGNKAFIGTQCSLERKP